MKLSKLLLISFLSVFLFSCVKNRIVLDPYLKVDWSTFTKHKAALHVHTLQSDGWQLLEEVVETYRDEGFAILAISDHDWNRPNVRVGPGKVSEENASPYPKDPKPYNYPANPTWPWPDYGGPKPGEVGMIGIQANELTFRHHINSFFSNYGVWYERTGTEAPYGGIIDEEGNEIWEDDQLNDINEKGGLAILNHPGVPDENAWWERKSLDWYVERYRNHLPEYLVGIEVTNNDSVTEKYDEGLWDQLLARFMPQRPIWGFGNNDMHTLSDARNTYTVFILDEFTEEAVREAMIRGQFYFCKASRRIDFRKDDMSDFPIINRIDVDKDAGTITIDASNYHKINWISAPESLDASKDYKTSNQPWALGRIVWEGETLNLRKRSDIKNYVRAELIRIDGDVTYRTFINPFGIAGSN